MKKHQYTCGSNLVDAWIPMPLCDERLNSCWACILSFAAKRLNSGCSLRCDERLNFDHYNMNSFDTWIKPGLPMTRGSNLADAWLKQHFHVVDTWIKPAVSNFPVDA